MAGDNIGALGESLWGGTEVVGCPAERVPIPPRPALSLSVLICADVSPSMDIYDAINTIGLLDETHVHR